MSQLLQPEPQEPNPLLSDSLVQPVARLVLEGFLRREELARQLGLSPRTIDRWEALRKGPPRVSIGRTILYNIQSVREWLVSQERQAFPAKRRRSFSGVKP
jgi:predicted DNA-binding transcriptional regulator AlpA